MRDKIKYEFSPGEHDAVLRSLNMLHNYLAAQDRSTDAVDEIICKLNNGKVHFDKVELGIVINALNNYRYKLKNMNEPRAEVNDILLKMIDDTENIGSKKKHLLRMLVPGNVRK